MPGGRLFPEPTEALARHDSTPAEFGEMPKFQETTKYHIICVVKIDPYFETTFQLKEEAAESD